MKIDLHTHSNKSDGSDDPGQVIARAHAIGLDVVALTDHDVADGWDEAQFVADRVGIRLVRGMEISTGHDGHGIHMLAYDLDPTHAPLVAELDKVLTARTRRISLILDRLAEHGIVLTEEEVAAHQGDARAAGRPHVADAMVEKKYVASREEAFADWLGDGKPGRVHKYNVPVFDAVRLVREAGGTAVIAHPWGRGSKQIMTPEFFADLAEAGLAGIEVDHSDHLDEERDALRAIALELDLVVTGSSDYHGTGKANPKNALGAHLTAPEEFEKLLG